MAGTAKPVVLLVWVGPRTHTEWRDSVAHRGRPGETRPPAPPPGPGARPRPTAARPACPPPTPTWRSRTGRTERPGSPRRWTGTMAPGRSCRLPPHAPIGVDYVPLVVANDVVDQVLVMG